MTKAASCVVEMLKSDGKWTKELAWEFRCGPDTGMTWVLMGSADKFGEDRDQVVQDFMLEITKLRFPGRKDSRNNS